MSVMRDENIRNNRISFRRESEGLEMGFSPFDLLTKVMRENREDPKKYELLRLMALGDLKSVPVSTWEFGGGRYTPTMGWAARLIQLAAQQIVLEHEGETALSDKEGFSMGIGTKIGPEADRILDRLNLFYDEDGGIIVDVEGRFKLDMSRAADNLKNLLTVLAKDKKTLLGVGVGLLFSFALSGCADRNSSAVPTVIVPGATPTTVEIIPSPVPTLVSEGSGGGIGDPAFWAELTRSGVYESDGYQHLVNVAERWLAYYGQATNRVFHEQSQNLYLIPVVNDPEKPDLSAGVGAVFMAEMSDEKWHLLLVPGQWQIDPPSVSGVYSIEARWMYKDLGVVEEDIDVASLRFIDGKYVLLDGIGEISVLFDEARGWIPPTPVPAPTSEPTKVFEPTATLSPEAEVATKIGLPEGDYHFETIRGIEHMFNAEGKLMAVKGWGGEWRNLEAMRQDFVTKVDGMLENDPTIAKHVGSMFMDIKDNLGVLGFTAGASVRYDGSVDLGEKGTVYPRELVPVYVVDENGVLRINWVGVVYNWKDEKGKWRSLEDGSYLVDKLPNGTVLYGSDGPTNLVYKAIEEQNIFPFYKPGSIFAFGLITKDKIDSFKIYSGANVIETSEVFRDFLRKVTPDNLEYGSFDVLEEMEFVYSSNLLQTGHKGILTAQ